MSALQDFFTGFRARTHRAPSFIDRSIAGGPVHPQSMEPIEISDKRLTERIAKEINISYTTLSSIEIEPFEFGNTITTDISSRGLSLIVDEPVEVPTLIQARIHLDGDPRGLIFLGRTVYCQPIDDSDVYRVGVKFIGILPADLRSLLDQISAVANGGSEKENSLET